MHIGFILILYISSCLPQKLIIEDSGLKNFRENDNIMVFYIQVKEEGPTSSRMYIEAAECCETISDDETDCGSMRLTGGDMDIAPYGTSRNLTLFFPTLYGYNRHGSCLVDITYNANHTKLRHRIDFNTVLRLGEIPIGLEPFYNPNEIIPCPTLDQDPFNACEPVICSVKYNGLRNYYNEEVGRCDKAPVCAEGTVYVPISNTCRNIDANVGKDDLITIIEQLPISDKDDIEGELVCRRGRRELGTCICEPGWQTAPSAQGSVDSLHFCNTPCPGSIFTNPSLIFYHIFEIIFASGIVGVILTFIFLSERRFQRRYQRIRVDNDDFYCYNYTNNVVRFQALPN